MYIPRYCVIEITMDVGIEGWLLMITRLIKKVNCKFQGVGNTIIILQRKWEEWNLQFH
jgi:hypothetical protein